jgi:hypothetical protein
MQIAIPLKATINRHDNEENLIQTASASAKPKTEASPKMQTPDACHSRRSTSMTLRRSEGEERVRRIMLAIMPRLPQIPVDKMIQRMLLPVAFSP